MIIGIITGLVIAFMIGALLWRWIWKGWKI